MLASTASFVNCVNGTNGRDIAVVKSSLIDLELLTSNVEDDRAQAEQFALAA